MDLILIMFVGGVCAYVAGKILSSEERNKVFNKRPIEVVDVKKYNRFCGLLVIGFGVVVEVTIIVSLIVGGIVSLLGTVLIILEAFAVMKIYNKNEIKMLKKR
ncbi:MAG: hypothetical protein NC432_01460 [Roseburia sp.]|nr:hypothetical protein [Roseburia sp.]MCM1098108.1 hypothetical protein [Ruminococcus flavefaciens]